jgi:RNA polymerase primary sigma factor
MHQSAWSFFDEFSDPERIPSYLSRIAKVPLLLPQEEAELTRKARDGDESAKRRLIESNMRLVLNIAKNYKNRAIPFEDLVQEGAIGLITAIERFDPDKGYRLSTYATHWIRQAIGRALCNKSKSIRIPSHVIETVRKIEQTRLKLARTLGREPSIDEIAQSSGISAEKLRVLYIAVQDTVSLEVTVGEDDSSELVSLIADENSENPELHTIQSAAIRGLRQMMLSLSERERQVMRMRLGLESDSPEGFKNIGEEFQLSRERVRQIELQAIKKLRALAEKRRIKEFFQED